MPEAFEALLYAARNEVTVSTPYYVPTESLQSALCASAHRGVKTTLIVPARNDSWIVSGASRSYFPELLEAGVIIYQYQGGLLHTKSLTVDEDTSLIGSANMDRRSFDLNYENNILFVDKKLTVEIKERQQQYILSSRLLTTEGAQLTVPGRLWTNFLAILGPVL